VKKNLFNRSSMIIAIIVFIIFIIAMIFIQGLVNPRDDFFPTLEEAFRAHSSGSQNFGEIMFVDEHEHNLTIHHGGYVTTFIKEERDGEIWYMARVVTIGNIYLNPPWSSSWMDFSPEQIFGLRNERGHFGRGARLVREDLGRFPLYGFSHNSAIYSLNINGIPVEQVVLLNENVSFPRIDYPVNLYFWYFSDFPPFGATAEDVVISFGDALE